MTQGVANFFQRRGFVRWIKGDQNGDRGVGPVMTVALDRKFPFGTAAAFGHDAVRTPERVFTAQTRRLVVPQRNACPIFARGKTQTLLKALEFFDILKSPPQGVGDQACHLRQAGQEIRRPDLVDGDVAKSHQWTPQAQDQRVHFLKLQRDDRAL